MWQCMIAIYVTVAVMVLFFTFSAHTIIQVRYLNTICDMLRDPFAENRRGMTMRPVIKRGGNPYIDFQTGDPPKEYTIMLAYKGN